MIEEEYDFILQMKSGSGKTLATILAAIYYVSLSK